MIYLYLDLVQASEKSQIAMVTGGTLLVLPDLGSAGINVRLERAGRLRD
jgi:hypothetical protein